MATKVLLTRGKVALVDDRDAAAVLRFKWQAVERRGTWYARRNFQGKRLAKSVPQPKRTVYLHVYILRFELAESKNAGVVIDHIDGDGLNCQRSNLRICTQQQNIAAMKMMRTNTSGYRGVRHDNRQNALAKRWEAYITQHSKRRSLGRFQTAHEAAHAYDAAAKELFGEFARLNFSDDKR